MKVVVGSMNPVKIGALKEAFKDTKYEIFGISVESFVRALFLSHEKTR